MSTEVQPLDSLAFPLHGRRLIEASAGTGKTYTIAALYLRLVLGHGGDNAYPRALLPPEILVVTFTNAATRELRERIRDRLAEAAQVFRGQKPAKDQFLQALLAEPAYADESAEEGTRAAAAYQLDRAAQWMDEAAIYTIHGWSQRMLSQHAFDSGSLFDQQLDNEDAELLREAVQDYWRTFCYPLPRAAARALGALAKDPQQLESLLKPMLGAYGAQLCLRGEPVPDAQSPTDFAAELMQWQQQREALESSARRLWVDGLDEVEQLLQQAVSQGVLSKASFKPDNLPQWLSEMRDWAEGSTADDKLLLRFSRANLRARTNKKFQFDGTPDHPAFDALETLTDYLGSAPDLSPVRRHAALWVSERFEQGKRRAARLGFDDLLSRLDQALHGEAGERLAAQIAQQYPVALIDEFQDTDPVQYRSFSRIYGGERAQASALLMIGDPKQAIYAFRGADIHTYLRARRDSAGALYTLGTNYRSSTAMVDAVNRLFQHAEKCDAGGAFQFARDGDNPLPFHPVEANGRRDVLEVDGKAQSALTGWWMDPEQMLTKEAFRAGIAESTASEICRLLTLGQQQRAGFRQADGSLKPLQPGDIAILVRTGTEAQWVRQALDRRAVRSVYLSDRESVFDTLEAQDLWRWLRACAEPEQPRLVHAALATATLDLGLAELDRLNRDESAWEAQVELFRSLRDAWRRQGVLALVRRLLDAFELPARLLQLSGGERVLTNILHLAEMLQAASVQLDGELALIRYLAEQLSGSGGDADERVVRLESDADRVQVITIHKSKGLEYPLVFLPFVSDCRKVSARAGSYLYHGDSGETLIELDAGDKDACARADRERLQEDLRLLYVALTRPVHACWLGLAPLKEVGNSALGQLLGIAEAGSDALQPAFAALCADVQLALEPLPAAGSDVLPAASTQQALRPAARFSRVFDSTRWWIASYSALCRLKGESAEQVVEGERAAESAADTARDSTLLESRDEPATAAPQLQGNADIHRFWKGPAAGTFLHGMLEWAAEEGFAAVADSRELRAEFLDPRCQRRDWQPWRALLDDWLHRLLTTPLPLGSPPTAEDSLRLCDLAGARAEMEFWFSAAPVRIAQLDALVRKHILPGQPRPELEDGQLNGMLKGFIDLTFEHRGRYWVADYKSNWLGPHSQSYTQAAMREAILHKRYDMQYVLYTLALHRLLKARVPGYAEDPAKGYEQYVGGALYMFLRGIDEPERRGAFVDRPPVELMLELDRLFSGHREENAHV
ncbi:exodeoxyribonuclease V subunit beta [Marinobacterium sp. D7]|uniref:exodeoxyribonuclease V subunit beta n=1 Tax=Marinobacterium ramblicola TaxID=2849041 RepID=UPI001C2DD2E0|nr:exodeoxyribonuclease V subunit beta [Marinobacterium ramblicola]MBV1786734.1 exodeoxyribonuclease V subunit beta [Marinobacterium ramblicola]